MDINKKIKQGDLGADAGKTKNGKLEINPNQKVKQGELCLLYTSPSPRDS